MIHRFSFIEKIILRFDIFPHPLVDAFLNVIAGRALQVAVAMGIVDVLEGEERVTLKEIQHRTGADREGLRAVLEVLVGLHYVEKRGDAYRLSRRGRKFFHRASGTALRSVILFAERIFQDFQHLEESIRSGKTVKELETYDAGEWRIFFGAMVDLARLQAKEVVRKIPFAKTHKIVLDVGGMHGLYAMESCRRVDGMRAEIVDLPAVQRMAEDLIRNEQMEGRVRFIARNFLTEPFTGMYDVVFLFSVIHGLTPAVNEALVKNIHGHVRPGGMVVVMDQFTDFGNNSDL